MRKAFGLALCDIYTFLQLCFQVFCEKTNINILFREIIEKVSKIFLVVSGGKRPFAKSRHRCGYNVVKLNLRKSYERMLTGLNWLAKGSSAGFS
jgi:hypothetical protein